MVSLLEVVLHYMATKRFLGVKGLNISSINEFVPVQTGSKEGRRNRECISRNLGSGI